MPTIGTQAYPYPNASDIPDGPAAFLQLGQRLALTTEALVSDLDALALLSASEYEPRRVEVDELNCGFVARDGVWVQDGIARVATAAARDTAFAKAANAYKVENAQVKRADVAYTESYFTTGVAISGWFPIFGDLPSALYSLGADNNFSATTNTVAMTNTFTNVPVGKYRVTWSFDFKIPASGAGNIQPKVNGTDQFGDAGFDGNSAGQRLPFTFVTHYTQATAGNMIMSLDVLSTAVGTKTLQAGAKMMYEYIGRA